MGIIFRLSGYHIHPGEVDTSFTVPPIRIQGEEPERGAHFYAQRLNLGT
jgi:hypothetical protein